VRKVDSLRTVSKWLVLVGALNWGLVGLVSYNLVDGLLGFSPMLVKLVYLLVGAAGVWGTYAKFSKKK